jgi:crotonobetainyl-CoA:carnitine CoA-transferase CaiB-like acyl-CoA transferase
MIQGMGGIMSVTGQPDGAPGAEPMKMGVAFADIFTGLHAVIGIEAALFHRERTGHGQYLDLALLDSQVAVMANQALNYLVGGRAPTRLGNAHPNIVPYQTFETADGYIIMAVGTDRQYAEYCGIIGAPHLAQDERFRTNRGRVENRAALTPLLRPFMQARTTADWVAAFEAAAVPCGPINTLDQVFANPQVLARGLQVGLTRDDGVQVPGVANPIVFSETPVAYDKPPPRLGDGTDKVLREQLGLSEEAISALRGKGVIG